MLPEGLGWCLIAETLASCLVHARHDVGNLVSGVVVKLGSLVLAGSKVLSAAGLFPPHNGGD